jgi:hypothetical protein
MFVSYTGPNVLCVKKKLLHRLCIYMHVIAIFSLIFVFFWPDKFLVVGGTDPSYNQSLTSPKLLFYGTSCLSLDVAKVHPHPYSASFLLIRPSYSYAPILEINDFSQLNSSWQRHEVTINNYYSGASLIFLATTFDAYVAIDNVNLTYGVCSSGKLSYQLFSINVLVVLMIQLCLILTFLY